MILYTIVDRTVMINWSVLMAFMKIPLRTLMTLMIGIKLVAAGILSVSMYMDAPPTTVGISVKRLIRKEPSFTVFALKESILIMVAVKKANTPATKKNSSVCVVDNPISLVPAESVISSFSAKEIRYPPTETTVLRHTKSNTVMVFARYRGFLLICVDKMPSNDPRSFSPQKRSKAMPAPPAEMNITIIMGPNTAIKEFPPSSELAVTSSNV